MDQVILHGVARKVAACLARYASGEDGTALGAEYEALFWAGEDVAANLVTTESA